MSLRESLRLLLPRPVRRLIPLLSGKPPVGGVDFGDLRRLSPISRHFGYDRGTPIDRYYIEQFLHRHAGDIAGRVLEIGDASYTTRFGGERVTTKDVLHVDANNPHATFVGDLGNADHLPSNAFDCFIVTQTLQLVYDLRPALATIERILKPGGVLLATVPGVCQISTDEWADYWCWSFTPQSASRLLAEHFPAERIEVDACGNVLAAISFLQGMAFEELDTEELDHRDPSYPFLLALRATKPA